MVNEAIYELIQEPSLNAADRFVVQQTSAATRATSATFALMGGLEINAIGTVGNTTATVGTIDVWTMAGEAANRTWTLPGTAQVGERCGIYIVDGDATDEILIHTDATGDKIGNSTGFHSAGTEFTRLFIENECMVFRCVSAGNPDWIVEYDGRIPCQGRMHLASTATDYLATTATLYQCDFDTTAYDVGGCSDITANHFLIRRAGTCFYAGMWSTDETLNDGTRIATWVQKNNGATNISALLLTLATNDTHQRIQAAGQAELSTGDELELWIRFTDAGLSNINLLGSATATYFEFHEVL